MSCFVFQGSTVARQASDKEKQKELPTYKDNDFINDGVMINIGKEAKERLESTLKADVDVSVLFWLFCCNVLCNINELYISSVIVVRLLSLLNHRLQGLTLSSFIQITTFLYHCLAKFTLLCTES